MRRNHLYGIAALAFHHKREETAVQPFAIWARCSSDAHRLALKKVRERYTPKDGWEDHEAFVVEIDPDIVDRARVEEQWYDQTGARSVFLAILRGKRNLENEEEDHAIGIEAFLSQCPDMAEDVARDLGKIGFPEEDGWTIEVNVALVNT